MSEYVLNLCMTFTANAGKILYFRIGLTFGLIRCSTDDINMQCQNTHNQTGATYTERTTNIVHDTHRTNFQQATAVLRATWVPRTSRTQRQQISCLPRTTTWAVCSTAFVSRLLQPYAPASWWRTLWMTKSVPFTEKRPRHSGSAPRDDAKVSPTSYLHITCKPSKSQLRDASSPKRGATF